MKSAILLIISLSVRFPALAVLDPDGLKRVWYTENKKSKIPVIMIPMIISALYVIAIVLI